MDHRRDLGVAGEELVAQRYRAAGYVVLDRNWRCREGELDLVLGADGVVVFCEVKTRRTGAFGPPFEAVTAAKQRRLRTLALRWLADHPRSGAVTLRFDVASVLAERGREPVIELIEHAF
jgi:putative endonuclease